MVTITLEISDEQAEALAQVCKRLCWVDARTLAVDDQEAKAIIGGTRILRGALADEGYEPE